MTENLEKQEPKKEASQNWNTEDWKFGFKVMSITHTITILICLGSIIFLGQYTIYISHEWQKEYYDLYEDYRELELENSELRCWKAKIEAIIEQKRKEKEQQNQNIKGPLAFRKINHVHKQNSFKFV